MNPRERICKHCGKSFIATYANEKRTFCSLRCSALYNKPSQALLITDKAEMSKRTVYRRRAAAGLTQAVFRYPFNETFFSNWSDELAWVLGLIWSDGCLFKNSIEICSIDYDLLELVEGLIEMPNGIRAKNNGKHWRIAFTSKAVADWLRSLGLIPAKSLTANFPAIPDEFTGAFVRGLLDGDGSVIESRSRPGQQVTDIIVQWVGASPYLRDGLLSWLNDNGITARVGVAKSRVWRIVIRQHDSLRKLHSLLYPHEGVCCLVRKRVNFECWMSTPRARSGRKKASSAPLG